MSISLATKGIIARGGAGAQAAKALALDVTIERDEFDIELERDEFDITVERCPT